MGAGLNARASSAGAPGPLRDATSCESPVTSASRPASQCVADIEDTPRAAGMEEASWPAPAQLMPPPARS